ncbi:MAG TPA: ABC transporter substrate-binding protein, partial [Thermoplasmata archaeon]|nr:ABC transporter substrate-binding protein [Thermoplasmata archaeon]
PPSPAGTVSKAVLAVAILVTAGVAVAGTAIAYNLLPRHAGQVTVVDDLGRKVDAPLNASRIVVLAPNVMDLVYRLGLRDRVVGVGCTVGEVGGIENEYSPNQTSLWGFNASICITDFPTLDTEKVASLEPQLVLASTITSAEQVQQLTDTYGLPVVILAPSTLPGIVGDVAIVAQLFPGVAGTADALEASLDAAIVNATNFDSYLSNNSIAIPTVFLTYGFYSGEYYTFGPGTFGQSLVDLAGGDSISAGLPLAYDGVNATAILASQPQVILYGTSWNDPYLVANQTPSVWASSAPYWSQLNGSKIAVDVTILTEADPTMVLALPWYLYDLHPTLYPKPSGTPP